jgi:hypothetical protein
MLVIKANCRLQFTAEDVEFVIATLGRRPGDSPALTTLMQEEESLDEILDNERLFHALLEQRGCLRVSPRFYFYVLVRQVFRRAGIEDRAVADYVAELLTEFGESERTRCRTPGSSAPLGYFFEMVAALETADDHLVFQLRTHIGNYSLFLSGVFPGHIRHRAGTRGSPDLGYYEDLGRSSFRAASDHRLARKYDLVRIFETLAERFRATRMALNDMSERLLTVAEPDLPLHVFLKN